MADTDGRYGVEARWLRAGPPSGHNYVRSVLRELAAAPDADRFVAFVRGSGRRVRGSALNLVAVPNVPSLMYNTIAVPVATPRDVRSVLYQNFTPPASRAGAATVIHDLIFLSNPDSFTPVERAYLGLIPILLRRAAVVVAVSEHVRTDVLANWPKRDPESVVVAPNAVADWLFAAAPAGPTASEETTRRDLGITRPYVLYLGRLNRRKNLSRLIKSFAAASSGGGPLVDHQLVLAGSSTRGVEDLREVARQAGVADRVVLTGGVPASSLPALLRGCDVFAYVSLAEGFGVPPLEAMVFGVPVVCSDIPPLRETAGFGRAQFVPPLDVDAIAAALGRAVTDSALRAEATINGPAAAARYRWSRTAGVIRHALELAARA